jgi:hypothetical protein
MRRLIALLVVAVALVAVALPATTAFAYDPLDAACGQGGADSTVCKSKGQTTNPLTGPNGVLTRVADILTIVGGVIVVIMMIIGGIKYITSSGDSSQASSAKNTIIYGLIGLVAITLARLVVGFVITRI